MPQLTESLVDDPQRAPQEHVRNCVAEQIKSVLVPQMWEPVVDLQLVPQERVQNRLGEHFVDVPVPQKKENGFQLVPQERVQTRATFTGKVFTVKMRHHRDEQAYAAETLGFIKGLEHGSWCWSSRPCPKTGLSCDSSWFPPRTRSFLESVQAGLLPAVLREFGWLQGG